MANLAALYYHGRGGWVVIGYGLVVSVAALMGLVAAWRRPGTRQLGLLWLGCTLLALGPVPWIFNRAYHPLALQWHGVAMSTLMPFTWFVRVPGLGNFREAARFTELGLVAAALLAGAAVNWLSARARPVLVVLLTLGLLEAGWSGNLTTRMWPIGVMPTALSALDAPIAADHSHAIVVDVPFGIRGGLPVTGRPFPPESMVLATADGHPLADGYASRIPSTTLAGIAQRPFYAALLKLQTGVAAGHLRAAARGAPQRAADARRMGARLGAQPRHPAVPAPSLAVPARHRVRLRLPGGRRLGVPARLGRRRCRVRAGRTRRAGLGGGVLGGGVLEEAFGGQPADQAAQTGGQPRAFLGGQAREDPRLT